MGKNQRKSQTHNDRRRRHNGYAHNDKRAFGEANQKENPMIE
jgi:hypothetical protein